MLLISTTAHAQVIRGGGNPYSSQLATDPDAGTVQGIQRYGKPLAADPAQGSGYPYFVFPSIRNPNQSSPFSGNPTVNLSPSQQLQVQRQIQSLNSMSAQQSELARRLEQRIKNAELANQPSIQLDPTEQRELGQLIKMRPSTSSVQNSFGNPNLANQASLSSLLSPSSRSHSIEEARQLLQAIQDPTATLSNAYVTYAAPVFVPARGLSVPGSAFKAFIEHQPLIQIKLRVVEVIRDDTLNAGSSLDYIRRRGSASEFMGTAVPNVNNATGGQNYLTSSSRYGADGLINVSNTATNLTGVTGAGALVNITSKHMNWIASLLATELEADVLTAPELVTTNGEGVEFVAGSKEPFNLGSVDPAPQGNLTPSILTPKPLSTRENSVFYKHIGTYLKITPRIVNYGGAGKGRGESSIVAADVQDWNLLLKFLINERLAPTNAELQGLKDAQALAANKLPHVWEPFARVGRLVPLETKTQVLECVNRFTKSDLRNYTLERANQDAGFEFAFLEMLKDCEAGGCNWKPEDCTIDIEVLARFSNKANTDTSNLPAGSITAGTDLPAGLTVESNVRAIANILQIKNGTGLVMAGLLGESDIEAVSKLPLLGDLPVVGYLFRSKSVSRKKSEILIFIEANVLSQDPTQAREESGTDLHLAKPYVNAGTLDNPLEVGLQRAGFGNYLPPTSHQEDLYWAKRGRQVNRIRTEIHDALR